MKGNHTDEHVWILPLCSCGGSDIYPGCQNQKDPAQKSQLKITLSPTHGC